ncbi:MAG TPA: hypothetical protein VFQ35_10490, partial [Polyangiaceae bacterium]|nr:hypothetical protein [Polyangiaceae bacterium]
MPSPDALRPAAVPQAATFLEQEREWAYGPFDGDGQRHGAWRFYSEAGALVRIAAYERGIPSGLCRRYEEGDVVEELHYVNGVVDGPYWRRLGADTYRCETAAFEVGTFDRGVRVGTVRLLDAGDQETARFELGRSAVDDDILKVGVLSIFPRTMTAWLELAERAFEEGRNEEGLASLARAVAKGADPALLERA